MVEFSIKGNFLVKVDEVEKIRVLKVTINNKKFYVNMFL